MKRKKWMEGKAPFSLPLALLACAAMLMGCSDDQKKADHAANSETPKGRYVEQAMALPFDPAKEWARNIAVTPEGQLTILTIDKQEDDGEGRIYRQKDSGEWETDDALTKQIPKDSTLRYMAYAGSDTYFLTYNNNDYYAGKAGEAETEWKKVKDHSSQDKEDSNFSATCFFANADGTVLLSFMEGQALAYNLNSGKKEVFAQAKRSSSQNTCSTLMGDTYVTANTQDFTMYSIKSGEELGSVPYQTGASDVNASLDSEGKQDLYLCNTAGIHHITLDGSTWETVVDGTLNSLCSPSNQIIQLCVGAHNDFFVLLDTADLEPSLLHYVYDSAVPSKTLTVYGLSMEDSQLVREGAAGFQIENPDVGIEVIDGRKQMEGMKDADIIRALNTELLNGKGADVLVLDGLPVQAYEEKGALEDMKGALGDLKDGSFQNLVGSFTQGDGAVYEMPLRILFPIVFGNDPAAKSFSNLEDLLNYQSSQDAGAIRGKAVYENILRQLSFLYYNELWDKDGDKLNEEAVGRLLSTVVQVGKNCGAQLTFDAAEDNNNGATYNQITENGFTDLGLLDLAEGKTTVALELPKSMEDMSIPFAVIKDNDYQIYSVNSNFYPSERIGINKNTGEKELAEAFVRYLLSEEMQSKDTKDGFPISPAGAAEWQKRKLSMSQGTGNYDSGQYLEGDYPDEVEKKEILDFLPELKNPVVLDSSVIRILTEESAGLFDGSEELDAVVKKIINKASLYKAEAD